MGSTPITVEPWQQSEFACECCGERSHTIRGELRDGRGATLAVYLAGWTENPAEHPDIYLALSLGPWGEDTSGDDRVNIPIVAFHDGATWQFGANDHGRLDDDPTLLGRRLGRDEILAHPRLAEIWALSDALWLGDPRLDEARAGR